MFSRFKEKYWGKELCNVAVESRYASCVYLWERNGKLSLNIRSKRFSYVQSPGRNDGTVSFELFEVDRLIDAIRSVAQTSKKLTGEGKIQ